MAIPPLAFKFRDGSIVIPIRDLEKIPSVSVLPEQETPKVCHDVPQDPTFFRFLSREFAAELTDRSHKPRQPFHCTDQGVQIGAHNPDPLERHISKVSLHRLADGAETVGERAHRASTSSAWRSIA